MKIVQVLATARETMDKNWDQWEAGLAPIAEAIRLGQKSAYLERRFHGGTHAQAKRAANARGRQLGRLLGFPDPFTLS